MSAVTETDRKLGVALLGDYGLSQHALGLIRAHVDSEVELARHGPFDHVLVPREDWEGMGLTMRTFSDKIKEQREEIARLTALLGVPT